MIMPFGKYEGQHIEDIQDTDYLKWLEEQPWLKDELREQIQWVLEVRQGDIASLGRVVNP